MLRTIGNGFYALFVVNHKLKNTLFVMSATGKTIPFSLNIRISAVEQTICLSTKLALHIKLANRSDEKTTVLKGRLRALFSYHFRPLRLQRGGKSQGRRAEVTAVKTGPNGRRRKDMNKQKLMELGLTEEQDDGVQALLDGAYVPAETDG